MISLSKLSGYYIHHQIQHEKKFTFVSQGVFMFAECLLRTTRQAMSV
jgi:hypothetical protein